jgi:hypothetical protein
VVVSGKPEEASPPHVDRDRAARGIHHIGQLLGGAAPSGESQDQSRSKSILEHAQVRPFCESDSELAVHWQYAPVQGGCDAVA